MLTTEAIESRAWLGLESLRKILGPKRVEFENGFYPTSISIAEVDQYRPVAIVAALVVQHRETLTQSVAAVSSEGERNSGRSQVLHELHELQGVLHMLAARLNSLSGEIQTVALAVSRVE
jgi:hypothetical protein